MLFEPMSNPAPSDASSFSVPCKHCAALLHPQERICPFCGYDQGTAAADPGADAVPADFVDTLPPLPDDEQTLILPRRDRHRPAGRGIVAVQTVPYRPPETFWQQEEPARRGPLSWVGGLAISFVAALALFALTLAIDYFYFDRRSEPGKARAFQSDIAEVRGALDRGDLGTAERTLDALDAGHDDNPALEPLREELDQRIQEQEARREHLRDAARQASKALGLAAPSAPAPAAPPIAPAASTSPTPPTPPTPVAAPPAATQAAPAAPVAAPASPPTPAVTATEPKCSQALAALALCSREAAGAP